MNKQLITICALLLVSSVMSTGGVHDVEVNSMPNAPDMPLPGGAKHYRFDANTNPEDKLAQETSISHIKSNIPDIDGYEFVQVVSASVQIVAGKKYSLILKFMNVSGNERFFEIDIWVKSWENFSEISKASEINAENINHDQPTIVGGQIPRELDIVNNPNDARVFKKAVQESSKLSPHYSVQEVTNVYTQLVAGVIYTFDITLESESSVDLEDITYTVKIILIPWQDVCDLISIVKKEEQQQMGQAYGGGKPYTFDIENNPVDNLIHGAVHTKVLASLGAESSRWNFVEIRNAERQIVSGSIYNFEIVYADANGNERVYFASVYVVPWENKLEINEFRLIH